MKDYQIVAENHPHISREKSSSYSTGDKSNGKYYLTIGVSIIFRY